MCKVLFFFFNMESLLCKIPQPEGKTTRKGICDHFLYLSIYTVQSQVTWTGAMGCRGGVWVGTCCKCKGFQGNNWNPKTWNCQQTIQRALIFFFFRPKETCFYQSESLFLSLVISKYHRTVLYSEVASCLIGQNLHPFPNFILQVCVIFVI